MTAIEIIISFLDNESNLNENEFNILIKQFFEFLFLLGNGEELRILNGFTEINDNSLNKLFFLNKILSLFTSIVKKRKETSIFLPSNEFCLFIKCILFDIIAFFKNESNLDPNMLKVNN